MIPFVPAPSRLLLECIKAGQAAHGEGLCRVDNPHAGRLRQSLSLLIRDADRAKMAEAWWKGWDLAEQAARGAPVADPEGDSPR